MTDVTDVSSIPLVHAPFYHLNLNLQLPVCEVKCLVVALHGLQDEYQHDRVLYVRCLNAPVVAYECYDKIFTDCSAKLVK